MKRTSVKNLKEKYGTNILVFPEDYRDTQPFYGTIISKKVSSILEQYVICEVIKPIFPDNDYSFTVDEGDIIYLFDDDNVWIIENEIEILAFII
jgi:hypothetical protein